MTEKLPGDPLDPGDKYLFIKRVVIGSGADDVQAIESEAFQCQFLRRATTGGIRVFDFKAQTAPLANEQQVKLPLIVYTPEVDLLLRGARNADDLLQGESLP